MAHQASFTREMSSAVSHLFLSAGRAKRGLQQLLLLLVQLGEALGSERGAS